MARVQKSTALYPHPFSRSYWRDAAAEMKDTRMLVICSEGCFVKYCYLHLIKTFFFVFLLIIT